MNNIFSLFEKKFEADPKRVCFSLNGIDYTNEQCLAYSAQFSGYLRKHNIQYGDRILVCTNKSAATFFLYLACLRTGVIFTPLSPDITSYELKYYIDDAKPDLTICESTDDRFGIVSLADVESDARQFHTTFKTQPVENSDVAVIMYTSGTTGEPKGAMLSHGNLSSNALCLVSTWGICDTDVLLHALPIHHVHGLMFAYHTALLSGARMIMLPKYKEEDVLKHLPYATVFMGVPTYYTRLLHQEALNPDVCQNMRLFTCGSAPLLVPTLDAFELRTGHRILERYGTTESGISISNPLDGERKAGTVGLPIKGVKVRIVDENNQSLHADEIGEVQVKGPNVFQGYFGVPEKSALSMTPDGYYKTGDLGFIDESGYITIVDRIKDLIITGGVNVYPREIEKEIDILMGVKESAVIGLPHKDYGESVTAVVVKMDIQLTEEKVINSLKGKLTGYKIPKKVIFRDHLPRNIMGKVEKSKLRQEYSVPPFI